jgi:hypothetical protein
MNLRYYLTEILLFLLMVITKNIFSQDLVIPPSPTASALGEYANVPVNEFTGKPEIVLPLWNVNTGDLNIPVSLSYNISDIKVEKIASNVGLGWSLNAGGVITRSVRNLPDDFEGAVGSYAFEGYLTYGIAGKVHNFDMYASESDLDENLNEFLDQWSNLVADTEPDIFYMNFAGKVCKFVFDQNHRVSLIPHQNWKVDCLFNAEGNIVGFTVVDENGIKYTFDQIETTTITTTNKHFWSIFTGKINNLPTTVSYTFNSSWYLAAIESTTGEEVLFNYVNQTINLDQRLAMTAKYCEDNECQGESDVSSVVHSITTKNIESIETNNSIVRFGYEINNRSDLNGSKALKELNIYSKIGAAESYIKGYEFNYDYFISPDIDLVTEKENYRRLKLESVTEIGKDSHSNPPTSFEYYYSDAVGSELRLPNRMSCEQDVWGYYNGNDAKTLIPKLYIYPNELERFRAYPIPDYDGEMVELPGADRLPNEEFLLANVIKKIVYPTGGYAEFTFESNSYLYEGDIYFGNGLRIQQITKNDKGNPEKDIVTKYNYADTYTNRSTSGVLFFKPQFAYLDYSDDYGVPFRYDVNLINFSHTDENGLHDQWQYYYRYNLKKYNICISSLGSSSIATGYREVRKEITGTGYTISKFSFPGLFSDQNDGNDPANPGGIINCWTQTHGYCDGLYEITNIRGQSAEFFDGDCMYDWAYFRQYFRPNEYPYPPHPNYDWNRGLLLSQKDYDSNDNLVKEKLFNYKVFFKNGLSPKIVYGLKIAYLNPLIGTIREGETCTPDLPKAVAKYEFLTDVSKKLESVIETLYDPYNGYVLISNTKDFDHNRFGQVSAIKQNLSNGDESKSYFKYVSDFGNEIICQNDYYSCYEDAIFNKLNCIMECVRDGGGDVCKNTCDAFYNLRMEMCENQLEICTQNYDEISLAINQMITENILSPTVEKHETRIENGIERVTAGELIKYKIFNEEFVKPSEVLSLKLNNPILVETFQKSAINTSGDFTNNSSYTTDLFYDKYDDSGNLLQYHKTNDIGVSYIWGYNGQYPIAKVTNATNNETFYTSFEGEEEDLKSFVNDDCVTTRAHSGKKSLEYTLSDPSLSIWERRYEVFNLKPVIDDLPKKYKYSGWVYSNGPRATVSLYFKKANGVYNSVGNATIAIINKWTYVEGEYLLPSAYDGSTVTDITLWVYGSDTPGKIWFDDLRLYPADAQMTTYTYEPLVGMTSQTGPDNKIRTYKYDDFGRLEFVKDHNGDVINKYTYHYKGEPVDEVTEDNVDLYILNLISPSTVYDNETSIDIEITYSNLGNINSNPCKLSVYISYDNKLDAGDVKVKEIDIPALNNDYGLGRILNLPLPAGLSLGTHYIIAKIDANNQNAESNESNNILFDQFNYVENSTGELNVSKTFILFKLGVYSTTFELTSNVNWTITASSWLTVTPTSGSNSNTISVSSNTHVSDMKGTITITGGGITRIINVTQLAEELQQ